MAIESVNPTTGEVIQRFDEYAPRLIDEILEAADRAFKSWSETGFDQRAAHMREAARLLRKDARECARIITLEMGKPVAQSLAEVEKSAWACDFYAENAEAFLAPRPVATDADQSHVRFDPLGAVLAVMPWNFPFWQVFRFAAPALMAGNVGVLKHASNVPMTALRIERIFREAGFPDGVFTALLISARAVDGVIRDRRIRAVTLTGSEAAGRRVAAVAGEALKKTVMELGGSDPYIVLSDADVARAARTAVMARLANGGQSCIAAKRMIVHKDVAEEFIARLLPLLEKVRVGDPLDEATQMGPMARTDLRNDLHLQVVRTVEQGATLCLGGRIPEGPGAFYPVTMLTGVTPGMTCADEEIFGPVVAVLTAHGDEEAIDMANRTDYGLGASLWTRDLDRAGNLARRIESGSVFVNGLVKSDPRLPFGGIKNSGYGRELSVEGIREFVNIKTVWMAK